MKKLLLLLSLSFCSLPAIATETTTYNTKCILTLKQIPKVQVCQVVENRNSEGFLNWRNIYALNYWVKSGFYNDKFVTEDSIRRNPYSWQYRANRQGYSQVSPELNVHNISWD
jgi:hypothetical protein